MSGVVRISEAASMALHAMVLLAAAPEERRSAKEIASRLAVSEAHLSKVLQRLGKAGLVESARGRKGGFALARPRDRIRLADVYQAIEGKLPRTQCLLGKPICRGGSCILGGLLQMVDTWLRAYFGGTKLSQLTDVYGGDGGAANRARKR